MSEEAPTEDIVAKYKRLLSMARSSLEANQTTIAAKDQYIANLLAALEEEKAKSAKKQAVKEDEASHLPRRILCRVDVEDKVWILIEYDDSDDIWKFFTDDQSMFDYLQRIPGVPLVCPPKCLTSQESHLIEEQSRSRVERIVEEFRRYKVRTEIARKQKDAENKQALLNGSTAPASTSVGGLSGTLEKALTNGSVNNDLALDESKRLKQLLEDQEAKWRSAYEKIARENETLRNKGGESVLATQWRNRYEGCLKERDELSDKLKKYTKLNDELGVDGVPVEQAFLDLQEEFRDFRRKVSAIEKRRKMEAAHHHHHSNSSSGEGGGATAGDSEISALIADYELEDSIERHHQESVSTSRKSLSHAHGSNNNGSGHNSSGGLGELGGGLSGGLTEAKILYVRSMIVQYLACKEPEVKSHMENALIVLFRLTAAEREAIDERRREESQDTLSSLTSFLGGLTSVNG